MPEGLFLNFSREIRWKQGRKMLIFCLAWGISGAFLRNYCMNITRIQKRCVNVVNIPRLRLGIYTIVHALNTILWIRNSLPFTHLFCVSNVHTSITLQKRTLNSSNQAKNRNFSALFSSDFSRKNCRRIQETIPFKVGVRVMCILHSQNNNIICTHSLFFFLMNLHRINLIFIHITLTL